MVALITAAIITCVLLLFTLIDRADGAAGIYTSAEDDGEALELVGKVEGSPPTLSDESVISNVAQSYGVPSDQAVRLAQYLQNLGIGGIGLFAIKQDHLGWIREQVLINGVEMDLLDPIQNAQVAMSLLSKWHTSGYDWPSCFLIYVYGFQAIQEKDRYGSFLSYIFEEGGYE
jgi:hypothetical protein